MGKVDDMRRLREQRYEEDQRAAAARAAAARPSPARSASAAPAPQRSGAEADVAAGGVALAEALAEAFVPRGRGPAPAAVPAPSGSGKADKASKRGKGTSAPRSDEQGACAECGKLRPLQGGMVTQHQKGFGKLCPGSRKPPATA
jgi:hypothetical protein